MEVRSISDILKEADETNELNVLDALHKEVVRNKKKYPLSQVKFADEHIMELTRKTARADSAKIKWFIDALKS